MPFLRWTSLLALATSAILTADRLHPGRAFCPLAAACEKARNSALGTLAGIPTSAIGMLAFGGLFLLTLLPLSVSRRALRPAGVVAGVTGASLILYQAFVIGSFCPLCLVADVAGLAAAGAVLGWRPPPIRRSGRPLAREPLDHQLRWLTLAAIVGALPFAWPRDERPSWVPLAGTNPLLADLGPVHAHPPAAAEVSASPESLPERPHAPVPASSPAPTSTHPTTSPLPPIPRLARDERGRVLLPPPAAARAMPLLPAVASGPTAFSARPTPSDPEGAPPWATFAPRATCPEPEAPPAIAPPPEVAPASARTPRAPVAPPPPPPPPSSERPVPVSPPADTRPEVGIVAYVNAFCPHCRVTHRRLGRVLAALGVTARVRRVYTWPGDGVPAWARACAHAQTLGLEDRFFDELAAAESDDLAEILAAGRRAGLDAGALRTAIATGGVAPRLERDLRIAGSAGLEGLPTLDIGRRRLLGEQTEGELREAIVAALALRRDAR